MESHRNHWSVIENSICSSPAYQKLHLIPQKRRYIIFILEYQPYITLLGQKLEFSVLSEFFFFFFFFLQLHAFLHDAHEQFYITYREGWRYWHALTTFPNCAKNSPYFGALVCQKVQPLNDSHKSFIGYYIFWMWQQETM